MGLEYFEIRCMCVCVCVHQIINLTLKYIEPYTHTFDFLALSTHL